MRRAGLMLCLVSACVDFDDTRAAVCAERPDLCGATAGGVDGSGGGEAGGSAPAGGSATAGGGLAGSAAGGGATAGGSGGGAAGGAPSSQLVFMPPSASFGTVTFGQSAARTLTLRNTGAATATFGWTLVDRSATGTDFSFDAGGCVALDAGDACAVSIVFRPSTDGLQRGNLFAGAADAGLQGTGYDPVQVVTFNVVIDGGPGGWLFSPDSGFRCDAGSTCVLTQPRPLTDGTYFDFQVAGPFSGVTFSGCSWTSRGCNVGLAAAEAVTATFAIPNFAFVTSTTMAPSSLGASGPARVTADAVCQAHAVDAGLPGTFRAMVSLDAGASSLLRDLVVTGAPHGWVRTDGLPVADGLDEFQAWLDYYPLALTERRVTLPAGEAVMTGTVGGSDCANWTSGLGAYDWGDPASSDFATHLPRRSCSLPARLYCLAIDKGLLVKPPPPPAGARFWYCAPPSPGAPVTGGRAAWDAVCRQAARAAGLPQFTDGGVVALVARPGETPIARISTAGSTWYRPDGVRLFNAAADLVNAQPLMTGAMPFGCRVISLGASSLVSAGTTMSTCSDHTSSMGSTPAVAGPDSLYDAFTVAGTNICGSYGVYCLNP